MSIIPPTVVSWFTPIIIALTSTNYWVIVPDEGKGVWEAIADLQDQIELLSDSGGLVSVCSFWPTGNGIEYAITNTNYDESSCLYKDNNCICEPFLKHFITVNLNVNAIAVGRRINFPVNKIYNTYKQLVTDDPDNNIPYYYLYMHEPI